MEYSNLADLGYKPMSAVRRTEKQRCVWRFYNKEKYVTVVHYMKEPTNENDSSPYSVLFDTQ